MKRYLVALLGILLLFVFVGCFSKKTPQGLSNNNYFAVGMTGNVIFDHYPALNEESIITYEFWITSCEKDSLLIRGVDSLDMVSLFTASKFNVTTNTWDSDSGYFNFSNGDTIWTGKASVKDTTRFSIKVKPLSTGKFSISFKTLLANRNEIEPSSPISNFGRVAEGAVGYIICVENNKGYDCTPDGKPSHLPYAICGDNTAYFYKSPINVALEIKGQLSLGQVVNLKATITSEINVNNSQIEVVLPEGVKAVGSIPLWKGNLIKHTPIQIIYPIKVERNGVWEVIVGASSQNYNGAGSIYLKVNDNNGKITS